MYDVLDEILFARKKLCGIRRAFVFFGEYKIK